MSIHTPSSYTVTTSTTHYEARRLLWHLMHSFCPLILHSIWTIHCQTSGYRSAVTDSALLRAPALFALTSSIITSRINCHFNPPRLRSTPQLLSMNNPRCREYDLLVTKSLPTPDGDGRNRELRWETTKPARIRCRGGGDSRYSFTTTYLRLPTWLVDFISCFKLLAFRSFYRASQDFNRIHNLWSRQRKFKKVYRHFSCGRSSSIVSPTISFSPQHHCILFLSFLCLPQVTFITQLSFLRYLDIASRPRQLSSI